MAKPGGGVGRAQGLQILGLAGVLFLLLGIGYYLGFYRSLAEDIENAEAQRTTLLSQETTWTTKQRAYRGDVEELNLRRARSREQVKILPTEADMDAFMDNLNSIADLSGLSILSTQPENEQPQEGFYARLPVRLEVRGRYFQLAKFLFNIGRVDRIINMQNLVLAEPELVDNEVVLKAKILATTFRALPETEPAAGATAATTAPATPGSPGG